MLDHEELRAWLVDLATIFEPSEVRLLGGEPLLHGNLDKVADVARKVYPQSWIVVISNGTRLKWPMVQKLSGVNELRITEYPATEAAVRKNLQDQRTMQWLEASHIKLSRRNVKEFRTTLRLDEDTVLTHRVFAACQMAHDWRCITLGAGFLFLCPQAYAFMRVRPQWISDNDALRISPGLTVEILLAFLERRTPLTACARCTGTFGILRPHDAVSGSDFLAGEAAAADLAVDLDYLMKIESSVGHMSRRDKDGS